MNYNFSVGDVIRSYDFRGNKECYVIGTVTEMDHNYITLDVILEVWQDKVLAVDKLAVRTSIEIMNDWTDRLIKLA